MLPFTPLSFRERAELARGLHTLIKSGIPLTESLAVLREESDSRRVRSILDDLERAAHGGTSLATALDRHRLAFGDIFISLVKAGEASGTLDENLSFLTELLDGIAELRAKVRTAFLYPEIVLGATLLLGGSLAVFILPRVVPLFAGLKVALPLPTRILLAITSFVQAYWHFLILGTAAGASVLYLLSSIGPTRNLLHRAQLKLPFLGGVWKTYQIAIVSQVLATLLKSGLAIHEVLAAGADAATNASYRSALGEIASRIEKGTPLSEAFGNHRSLFPKNFIAVIAVGERSGTLEGSFAHLAEGYRRGVDRSIKKLPVVLEPLLLIGIGLAVGFVAISIILPVYRLTQGFRLP